MFSLLTGVWQLCTVKIEYRVLVLGLDNAGKTTLVEQMRHIYSGSTMPNKISPTVGLNIAKLDVNNANIVFWDLGGQQALRVLWDKYFNESNAILFVVDAHDSKRFSECQRELAQLLEDPVLYDAPLLLFFNKHDAFDHINAPDIIEALGIDLHTRRPIHIEMVSGLTKHGIQNGILWLLKTLPFCDRTNRLGVTFAN